mgnify:CR=1 FL=1
MYKRQVYDTMVENIDEYIDAIFKSNKDSLLHRYIRYNLVSGLLYEEVIDNCPEEYVLNEHNEALFHLFGYSFADVGELPPEYPDFNDEYFDEWEEFAIVRILMTSGQTMYFMFYFQIRISYSGSIQKWQGWFRNLKLQIIRMI